MSTLYVGTADVDLRAVVAHLKVGEATVKVTEDGDAFAGRRPVLVNSADANAVPVEGVKTIAAFLAETARPTLLGASAAEKAAVDQWLSFAVADLRTPILAKNTKQLRDSIRFLNEHLLTRTYLALDSRLSLADVVAWANLHSYMLNLSKKQRVEVANLTRWYDLVQHTVDVSLAQLPAISIDLDAEADGTAAPHPPSKTAAPAPAPASAPAAGTVAPSAPAVDAKPAAPSPADKEKKEKKPKDEKKAAAPAKPAADSGDGADGPDANDDRPPISRLDLRVGRIVDVKRHENADSLYVEQIEMGDAAPRTVVSGLVRFIPIENMRDQTIIVLANLKPAAMRGVKSEAMVMCATSPDGATVEFLRPPPGSKPGDRVYFEGFEGTPDAVLNPKKKIFETVQPDFTTTDDRVATWKGVPFRTALGVVTSETVVKGTIK